MQNRPDPLDKLFESGSETNREVAKFLLDYIRIDPETLDVLFMPNTTIRSRILLYLLAMNLMSRVGKRKNIEARAKEISLGVNADGNTVRPLLMLLLQARMVERSNKGMYSVPLNKMQVIKADLEKTAKN